MKKLSPLLTWKHQDTSVRTNGKRSQATVSWMLSWTSVCANRAWGLGVRQEAGGAWGMAGPVEAWAWQATAE